MKHSLLTFLSVILVGTSVSSFPVHASDPQRTLVITMTNDPQYNAIIVVDAATHERLQTLSTNGKGGVGGNARGVDQYKGRLFAAVNNGSGTVALFQRAGNRLVFEHLIVTTSAPVSVNFANGHMYVAGTTTVDSFTMNGSHVGFLDGTTALTLAGGGLLRKVRLLRLPARKRLPAEVRRVHRGIPGKEQRLGVHEHGEDASTGLRAPQNQQAEVSL